MDDREKMIARAAGHPEDQSKRIESLTFTLGLVIGMMAGLFATMVHMVYIATR